MPPRRTPSPAKRGRDGEGASPRPHTPIIPALFLLATGAAASHAQGQPTTPPPGTRTECNSAGLALAAIGETLLHTYTDGHGHTVELWCHRGLFASNYDLRIVEAGQSRTIAGCYFNEAENTGPLLHLAPSGAYTRVEWLNQSRKATGTSYRFSYDFAAREITVTATAACRAPVTLTLPPQPDVAALERRLPPAADCPD